MKKIENNLKEEFNSKFNFKIDKKDICILLVMCLIYLGIALINLGDLKAPQSGWTPQYVGENFIIEFLEPIEIDRINYYCGLGRDREVELKMKVQYLNERNEFLNITNNGDKVIIDKNKGEVFKWKHLSFDKVKTDKLRLYVENTGGEINEIAVYESGSEIPVKNIKVIEKSVVDDKYGSPENLFDEPEAVKYNSTYLNSTYFDEIYHARTAYEHLHGIKQFENSHPPLGKIFISLGIAIFGMVPFGWRIVGTLFGVAMIPVMYLFGMKLFNNKFYAFCCAFLMMFDFMHFAQTRIATIDVYGTFFVMLMYYYMFDVYMNKSYEENSKKYFRSLMLSGIMFGIGVACKWIALYAGLGLAILFFSSKYKEYIEYKNCVNGRKVPQWTKIFLSKYLYKSLLYGFIFFVVVPIIIYGLSYIPVLIADNKGNYISEILNYTKHMYNYHSKGVLSATHPFSSKWYEWPIMKIPIWYYINSELPQNLTSTIVSFGNPAIWWLSIISIIASAVIAIKKKDKKMVPVFIAFIFQYVPWMFVDRIVFIYHFFSAIPFVIFSIIYMFKYFIDKNIKNKYILYAYLGIVILLFIMFYPALSGLVVPKEYIKSLRWFSSWIF